MLMLLLGEVATRLLTDIGPPIRVRDREIGNRYRRDHQTELFVPEGAVPQDESAAQVRSFPKSSDIRKLRIRGHSFFKISDYLDILKIVFLGKI